MAALEETHLDERTIPISGRRLTVPAGPVWRLQRAAAADYEIGEFRAWAGYKNLGSDIATDGLAHFQHVVSFADTQAAGRTGIHAHFAHAHIVIPTSGRGVFSYDGITTEAVPGAVIVQHGGTVHDQFDYSFSGAGDAENRRTPQSVEPVAEGAPTQSFGFLELFVPKSFANVEIVPPGEVTDALQRSAWDHPYHSAGCRYALQETDAPDAAWRLLSGAPGLEVRDAQTWAASGGLVATWIVRPATGGPLAAAPVRPEIAGEHGGIEILYMVGGSATFISAAGKTFGMGPGDTLTCDQGAVGDPLNPTVDMRLVRFFIARRAQQLRERTADEIAAVEALGPRVITRREVRPDGDTRPVNVLRSE